MKGFLTQMQIKRLERKAVMQEYASLSDQEKKELNTIALSEFEKPIQLRFAAFMLINFVKARRTMKIIKKKGSKKQ